MSAPTTGGLVGTTPCPHPGCPIAIRMVYNRRQNRLKYYHGENLLVEMELDATQIINGGKSLPAVLTESRESAPDEYQRTIVALGTMAAFAIAELHYGPT